jgi:hypothetical protein
MNDIDFENDQSIINATRLIQTKPGYYTFALALPDGTEQTHTELSAEDARKVMGKWCEHIRSVWRGKEAAEQARVSEIIARKKREITPERQAELAANLPLSQKEQDEAAGNALVARKPRAEQPQPIKTPAVEQLQPFNTQDPLAYAKQQYVYWTEEEAKLERATAMRVKWERVLQVLRDE